METARVRIRNALVTLLSENEFSKISVTDICKEAGLSRVTFYLWYDSKDKLLNDYFQDIVNEGVSYYQQLRESYRSYSVQADFHSLLETIFYLANRYHEFAAHLFSKTGQEDQVLYVRFNSLVMKQVKELTREHSDKIKKPLTMAETATFLASGLNSMIRADLSAGMAPETVHAHAAAMLDHVMAGLFA